MKTIIDGKVVFGFNTVSDK